MIPLDVFLVMPTAELAEGKLTWIDMLVGSPSIVKREARAQGHTALTLEETIEFVTGLSQALEKATQALEKAVRYNGRN